MKYLVHEDESPTRPENHVTVCFGTEIEHVVIFEARGLTDESVTDLKIAYKLLNATLEKMGEA